MSARTEIPEDAQETSSPRKSPARKASPSDSKQVNNEETPRAMLTACSDPKKRGQSSESADTTTETEVLLGKSVAKKTIGETVTLASARASTKQTPKTAHALNREIDESTGNKELMELKDSECGTNQEAGSEKTGELAEEGLITMEAEEAVVGNVIETKGEEIIVKVDEESGKREHTKAEAEVTTLENTQDSKKSEEARKNREEEPSVQEVAKLPRSETHNSSNKLADVEGNKRDELQVEYDELEQNAYGGDEAFEEYGDHVDFEDPEEEILEDDVEEPAEETQTLEEEHKELTAAARERMIKKEHEIFVGGLDRDATEVDIRRVFEKFGEVVEVRLHKNHSTNKNKGYAFVKFASKEDAKRALSEMKNPVICGKRCGTAPSEDNDTLFLGNICNTWTKEAIRQKLKDYGIEGVENITLVPDVQHEGLSRGFSFLEFSCHVDAMLAYKRLQKPDVVFGHPDRTAKVAFAEPLREPDPEIMANVKTVFLDGLPPHWDEKCVREKLKAYGEILRVVLARNMPSAKRKDYGFVDFSTHEAAVSCIDGVNNTELTGGNSKTKVKARLSNPLPKTQAVKGGMCGGFLINRRGTGTFSRSGRSFGRVRRQFNWPNLHHNRVIDRRGRGQTSRVGHSEHRFDNRNPEYHGRQTMGRGGRRGPLRGRYHGYGRGFPASGPSRQYFSRPWYDAPDRGPREPSFSRRNPFPPEELFERPFNGRQYDNPYIYDEANHGVKRPFYMTHHEPGYMEPRRVRPRPDYTDPAVSFQGPHYHDTFGSGEDYYPSDYYGSDYGTYPPYYGGDHPYGGGRGYYY